MSSNENAIEVRNLTKTYKIWKTPSARLKATLWTLVSRASERFSQKYFQLFNALDGVDFEVRKGECLGVIGKNGAGKSTLLQIIAGTLQPSSGNIYLSGKVAALLELGAGFNPEFTGRENIQINASILGISQNEIQKRVPSIIEYSEIADFIDQPVKTYSSGMQMRLAFAIAVHVDAEIYIIDEALSVGDAWFQLKCSKTIEKLVRSGKTFLLVSHSSIAIKQFCNRAILIDKGKIVENGDPNHVCNIYSKLLSGLSTEQTFENVVAERPKEEETHLKSSNEEESRENRLEQALKKLLTTKNAQINSTTEIAEFEYGKQNGKLDAIEILDPTGREKRTFLPGEKMLIRFKATSFAKHDSSIFGLTVKRQDGQEVYLYNTMFVGHETPSFSENESSRIEISSTLNLVSGEYFLSLGWVNLVDDKLEVIHRKYDFAKVTILPEDHCAGIANLYSKIQIETPHA